MTQDLTPCANYAHTMTNPPPFYACQSRLRMPISRVNLPPAAPQDAARTPARSKNEQDGPVSVKHWRNGRWAPQSRRAASVRGTWARAAATSLRAIFALGVTAMARFRHRNFLALADASIASRRSAQLQECLPQALPGLSVEMRVHRVACFSRNCGSAAVPEVCKKPRNFLAGRSTGPSDW